MPDNRTWTVIWIVTLLLQTTGGLAASAWGPSWSSSSSNSGTSSSSLITPPIEPLPEQLLFNCLHALTTSSNNPPITWFSPEDPQYRHLQRQVSQTRDTAVKQPSVIFRPKSPQEVSRVVSCANTAALPFVVRNGGHSYEGVSTIGSSGIVVDLGDLQQLHFIQAGAEAAPGVIAGAGWLQGPLSLELTQRGYMLPGSTHPGLGISGLTLGGGLGFATRAVGLTSDKVLAALVVTAEGEIITASKTNNTDLFFALRGGGGNYGIVTSWGFELSDMPSRQVTMLKYGWQCTTEAHQAGVLAAVLAAWNRWQPWLLPEEYAMVELLVGE